ncbi:MAG: HAD hydrolase-like protein [Streptosporangiaceae bacterium]
MTGGRRVAERTQDTVTGLGACERVATRPGRRLIQPVTRDAQPGREPYLTGLKRFGATREETLVVEDSPRGLKSAVAAGIDCAIVHNDFTHSPDSSEASYRIEALIELRDIVVSET